MTCSSQNASSTVGRKGNLSPSTRRHWPRGTEIGSHQTAVTAQLSGSSTSSHWTMEAASLHTCISYWTRLAAADETLNLPGRLPFCANLPPSRLSRTSPRAKRRPPHLQACSLSQLLRSLGLHWSLTVAAHLGRLLGAIPPLFPSC